MVYGPAPPAGSTTDSLGRTIVPKRKSSGGGGSSGSQSRATDTAAQTAQIEEQARQEAKAIAEEAVNQAQKSAAEEAAKQEQIKRNQDFIKKNIFNNKNFFIDDRFKQSKYQQPYIEKIVTGSIDSGEGYSIPTTRLRYVNPNTGEVRWANQEEEDFVNSQPKELQTWKDKNIIQKIYRKIPYKVKVPIENIKRNTREIIASAIEYSKQLSQEIEQNKINISKNERQEYFYLGQKRNKTQEEKERFNQLARKVADQTKATNQRIIDTVIKTSIDTGIGIGSLVNSLTKDPIKTIKALPSSFVEGIRSDFRLLRTDPLVGIIKIGTEIIIFKAISKIGKEAIEGISNKLVKYNPKFVGEAEPGAKLIINLGEGRTTTLTVVSRIPKESLISQVEKAGKTLTATSSQAESLLKLVRNNKIIRKPIPGEENFSQFIKQLLKKFDNGQITIKETLLLNKLIKNQGAKGLLERSFFADPTGKIRPSRLGILPQSGKGNILDYFRNGITFRKAKPQILLFDNINIQSFPKNLLNVARKLKRGISLTTEEADALLKWQLKKSGKFKPVGFITRESELTLAPGEILRRQKKIGITIINGRRVPIIKAEVIKPVGRLKQILDKIEDGVATKSEGMEAVYLLRKQTGMKYTFSSLKRDTARYFSLKRAGLSSVTYLSKSFKLSSPIKSYPVLSRTSLPSRSVVKYSGKIKIYPSKGYGKSPPRYPPRLPPKSPPRYPPRYFSKNKLKQFIKSKPGYFDVWAKPIKTKSGRVAKRFIKVNKTPLKQNEARDLRNYITDTSLSRTARLVPSKKKPGRINISFPRGYALKTQNKFRSFRIVKGKRVPLPSGRVIEKTRNILDTRQEKSRIDLLKRIKQLEIKKTTTIKRPVRFKKGSMAAKQYMAKLRSMRR